MIPLGSSESFTRRIKAALDPAAIFNPGRMVAGL